MLTLRSINQSQPSNKPSNRREQNRISNSKRESRGGGCVCQGVRGQEVAELHTKQKPAATAAAGQLKLVTSTKRLQCAAEITAKHRAVARCV